MARKPKPATRSVGRPKRPEGQPEPVKITSTFSPSERDEIRDAASQAAKLVAPFIRETLLKSIRSAKRKTKT